MNAARALGFRFLLSVTLLTGVAPLAAQQTGPAKADHPPAASPGLTLRTNVNRVVLDVVVTDAGGKPVSGLTRDDFFVNENNQPQLVLFFDVHSFSGTMDYTPPKLPAEPLNTFVNLPATPERGPLYVLLYDLVNTRLEDQAYARKQLVKFIQNKPAGARFAIFVSSDGLHLVQGFTSDQQELLAAIDPSHPRPHVPRIFLMGTNFGAGDKLSMAGKLSFLASYLEGLPGRKNLIWLASDFPLSLFPNSDDVPIYQREAKKTLDLLARDQIALYPVDVRGVISTEEFASSGATSGGGVTSDSRELNTTASSSGAAGGSSSITTPAPGGQPAGGGQAAGGPGYSLTASSYMTQEEIANATGGKAFYSSNDINGSLQQVTETGGNYYTLTYAPANHELDGKLRKIKVVLRRKSYHLAYRQAYYATDPDAPPAGSKPARNQLASFSTPSDPDDQAAAAAPVRRRGDTLAANMEHGAPTVHQLIFGAHIRPLGVAAAGTPEQMANLASQPAFFKERRRHAAAKPLQPMTLQSFAIDYTVMAHQFLVAGETTPNIEIAAAAYDSDGRILNATVNNATEDRQTDGPGQPAKSKAYRVEQRLDVPLTAKFIRLAVRDANTDRIGAMEIPLPLALENQAAMVP